MTTKLPPSSFTALAAVAWADGRMTKVESQGLIHAARKLGLEADDLAQVERATREKVTLEGFDASKLGLWERLLTYGLASWLSRIDGLQQQVETESLRELGRKLGVGADITDHRLGVAAAVATDIAMLPEGRRPDR